MNCSDTYAHVIAQKSDGRKHAAERAEGNTAAGETQRAGLGGIRVASLSCTCQATTFLKTKPSEFIIR